ncbi:CDP-diacylglycerol--serine O-phosphatidyltransferase [Planctomycetota bacterium]
MQRVKAESTKNSLLHRMRKQRLKSITVLPSLITILNGLCGFAAIVFASKATASESGSLSQFALAGYMILLAMIADMLDGRVARMSQSTSSFGGQLDSLCDIISFGVAPAFIMLKILEYRLADLMPSIAIVDSFLQRFIWLSAAAYISCAAIRLARFNVENEEDESSHMSFIGLPTPAAAGVVASLVIFQQETLPEIAEHSAKAYDICDYTIIYALPFIVFGLGVLMVSRIRYPHVLNQYMKGKKPLAYLMTCLFVLGLIIWFRQVALVLGFCGFAMSAFLKRLSSGRNPKAEPIKADDDDI